MVNRETFAVLYGMYELVLTALLAHAGFTGWAAVNVVVSLIVAGIIFDGGMFNKAEDEAGREA